MNTADTDGFEIAIRTYLKRLKRTTGPGELDEAKEVVGVVFPANEDATLPFVG